MVKFEHLFIKIRKETAEVIRKIKNDTGMTEGEIIERSLMKVSAKDSSIAPIVALQELMIVFSQLDEEESSKAILETMILFMAGIPLSKDITNAMYEKAIEKQKEMNNGNLIIDKESEEEILKTIISLE